MGEDQLLLLLNRLQQESAVLLESEEATKQGVLLPILSRLGWDRDNVREVIPEYRIENGRIDYCLRLGPKSAVFIEAKRADQELDRHQEQLLDYAFREGVELAALTNGMIWWLYLPLIQGSWEQRKFFTIDIAQQDPTAVAEHFSAYLSRQTVADGSAVRRAKALHESRAKERLTAETLPRAWLQLLEEPDELLAELLSEKVESLSGHKPTPDQIADFLAKIVGGKTIASKQSIPTAQPKPPQPVEMPRSSHGAGYTFRRPTAFSLLGQTHQSSTWKEVLVGLCAEIAKRHPDDFAKVLQLKGRKRDYFSYDYRRMTSPEGIQGTKMFVETNLSANGIVKRCYQILQMFSYKRSDFDVTLS